MKGDLSTKAKINNDKISYEASYKPKDYNDDNMSASGKVSFNYKPSSGNYDGAHAVKFGSSDIGGVRIWAAVSFG